MTTVEDKWECACGLLFDTEEEFLKGHMGPGHPWASKMIEENMAFIHGPGDDWMSAEVGNKEGESNENPS